MTLAEELLMITRRLRMETFRPVEPLRWRPPADLYEGANGWLIKLALPGVRPEDVRLRVCGNFLAVSGRRVDEESNRGLRLRSMEIVYAEFERGFEFPVPIENAQIETEFRHGMLLVSVIPEGCR